MGVRWGRPIHLAGLAPRYDRIGPLRGSDVDGAINRYGSLRYTTLVARILGIDTRIPRRLLATNGSICLDVVPFHRNFPIQSSSSAPTATATRTLDLEAHRKGSALYLEKRSC